MPIRASEKARYPKDWPAISRRIRDRAGNCCEFCSIENYALGARTKYGDWLPAQPINGEMPAPGEWAWCGDGETTGRAKLKVVKIVLTVAHLDHTPENVDDENLKALCQRCHLTYDAKHHAKNAAETRRRRRAEADLFDAA